MTEEEKREYFRKWREAHKEHLREYNKKYWLEHKEELTKYQRQYHEEHRDHIRARMRQYISEHREEQNKRVNNYHQTKRGRATNLLASYVQFDLNKGYRRPYLTRDDIIRKCFSEDSKCVYCGEDDWHVLGLDRIIREQPHDNTNTLCCCHSCNCKRNRFGFMWYLSELGLTFEDFLKQNGAEYGDDYIIIKNPEISPYSGSDE